MKFKYTSIGANNQKLEGILDAESLESARDQLHKMNLSVIAIDEVSGEEAAQVQPPSPTQPTQEAAAAAPSAGIISYYFSARDPQQKEVNGTIDSPDPYSAYRRLITEYQFKVLDLFPEGSPDPAAASLKPQFEEWDQLLEEEGVSPTARPVAGTKDELEDEGEKMSQEIVTEIDQFIINTKKILQSHGGQYSDRFQREIQKTLDDLERIRTSNNLKHITKVCNNLYQLIAHPDIAFTEETRPQSGQEYEEIISKLKDSGFISNPFAFLRAHNLKKKSARFDRIQKLFSKILSRLSKKQGEAFSRKLTNKKKSRQARWISNLTKSLQGQKNQPKHITLKTVIRKFFAWIKESNTILRRARKQEMISAYREWKAYRAKAKADRKAGKKPEEGEVPRKDFSDFYMELDSFVGWLLFFYIAYFFIVSFSLEKDVGLSQNLVLRTLGSPLLVNIAIFLVFAHLALTLKIRLFRGHALSSLFLFFLCFGAYTLLIVNF
jgi:hypothetical protein